MQDGDMQRFRQIVKFDVEICSHPMAIKMVTSVGGVGMVDEVDADGDPQVQMPTAVWVVSLTCFHSSY